MKLLLVRHGATEWSASGKHTGVTDIPLTDEGRGQAEAARHRVRATLGTASWTAWSSPLIRARTTAEIVLDGGPFTLDSRIVEFNYGEYEGLTTPQIQQFNHGWSTWQGCPGGETVADVSRRVDSFLADVRATNPEVAIVFAHGHLLRILGSRAIQQPGEFGVHLFLDTAAICEISDLRDGPAITLWNEVGRAS